MGERMVERKDEQDAGLALPLLLPPDQVAGESFFSASGPADDVRGFSHM